MMDLSKLKTGMGWPTAGWLFVLLLALILSACSGGAGGIRAWGTAGPSATPFQPGTRAVQTTAPPPAVGETNPNTAPALPAAPPLPTHTALPTRTPAPLTTEAHPVEQPVVQAVHHSGQTFLTWPERTELQGERYRVYRSTQPINADNLGTAALLAEVGKHSARFYTNRYIDAEGWHLRYIENLVIQDGDAPLPEGTGLLVWTLSTQDFDGQPSGIGYYAVTVQPADGVETFSAAFTFGPVSETVQDPLPVEFTRARGVDPGPQGHYYIQYMDLRNWNPTFHAPNEINRYYGENPQDPNLAAALQYAYDYVIFSPIPEKCADNRVPDPAPVIVYLHGWKGNRYVAARGAPFPFCAYEIIPTDMSETWYFGFARSHDYRQPGSVAAGDVIENYTEQRVLRMVYDLMRKPPGPAVDPRRIYLFGHSMGGSGALGFGQRYPNVFAAVYSAEPITDYRTAGVTEQDWAANVAVKWGSPELNLPIEIRAPGGWAAPLQKYNGTGVWDWQNYMGSYTSARNGDLMTPMGVDHGIRDDVIIWTAQGQPLYPLLNQSRQVWAGRVTDAEHDWSNFAGLPPSLGLVNDVPFWNFQVVRDETVPGLSHLSTNTPMPPEAPIAYNQTVKWSASWDAWDGPPVDEKARWQMSFCAVEVGSLKCGSGPAQTVDITPRRLQRFVVQPGAEYAWENRRASDNRLVASGVVKAGEDGLITVPGFEVAPEGSRLVIKPR